ncbi:MAG: hypothetical protein WAK82_01695 [Streptosporangiaceae bacterium]
MEFLQLAVHPQQEHVQPEPEALHGIRRHKGTHGYQVAFGASAGMMLLAVLAALVLPREPRRG